MVKWEKLLSLLMHISLCCIVITTNKSGKIHDVAYFKKKSSTIFVKYHCLSIPKNDILILQLTYNTEEYLKQNENAIIKVNLLFHLYRVLLTTCKCTHQAVYVHNF